MKFLPLACHQHKLRAKYVASIDDVERPGHAPAGQLGRSAQRRHPCRRRHSRKFVLELSQQQLAKWHVASCHKSNREAKRKGKEGEWGRTRTESVYWIRIFSRFALCQTIFSPLFPANLSLAVGFCNQGFVCFYFGPFSFLRLLKHGCGDSLNWPFYCSTCRRHALDLERFV